MTENIHTIELTFYLKNMNLKINVPLLLHHHHQQIDVQCWTKLSSSGDLPKSPRFAGGLMTTALVLTIQVDASAHPLS